MSLKKLYRNQTKGDAIIVNRCRSASDVGSAVLTSTKKPTYIPDFRWSRNNGIRTWSCDWCKDWGDPDKTVVNIAGDGCFRMNMNEIATAVRLPYTSLLQVVMNNHVLGMVRQWQTLFYDHRYSHTVLERCRGFCENWQRRMGAKGFRVTRRWMK